MKFLVRVAKFFLEKSSAFLLHTIKTRLRSVLIESSTHKLKSPLQRMSTMSFLDFQYNFSKKKFLPKPSHLFSRTRKNSGLMAKFEKFDSIKDGKISLQKYKAIVRAISMGPVIREVGNIFRVVDLDGDGFINFKEFMEAHKEGGGIKTTDIETAFRTYDSNGDGKISAEEVLQMMIRLWEKCSLEDCRRMVREVDADGDGMVDMDEFMIMMTRAMKTG